MENPIGMNRSNFTTALTISCRFEVVPIAFSFLYKGKSYQKIDNVKIGGFKMGWAIDLEGNKKLFEGDTWCEGIAISGR
jgi:hypothetical protein